MSTPELDDATKARLAEEVERLVRMGEDRKKARRIVWEDYLDELAAYAAPATAQPEPSPPDIPVPEPPPDVAVPVTKPVQMPSRQRFWRASDEVPMTPEQLQRNRAELARIKQLVGLRK
ncbi:hypothetical protein [Pseudogulbenkiania ferrooxidans]|uniref:hypothetical protein n=1 Tax=Pseudogulbenkiania ferrooxidans TaxID=549169 RepID=UPI00058F3E0F|nr:hypothetical protein [Pseudogulbenkiania ferrooxidans]